MTRPASGICFSISLPIHSGVSVSVTPDEQRALTDPWIQVAEILVDHLHEGPAHLFIQRIVIAASVLLPQLFFPVLGRPLQERDLFDLVAVSLQPFEFSASFGGFLGRFRPDARRSGKDHPVKPFRIIGRNPGCDAAAEAVGDYGTRCESGPVQQFLQAFGIFGNTPGFRGPSAFSMPREVNQEHLMIVFERVGNRLHHILTTAPPVQEDHPACSFSLNLIGDPGSMQILRHSSSTGTTCQIYRHFVRLISYLRYMSSGTSVIRSNRHPSRWHVFRLGSLSGSYVMTALVFPDLLISSRISRQAR